MGAVVISWVMADTLQYISLIPYTLHIGEEDDAGSYSEIGRSRGECVLRLVA